MTQVVEEIIQDMPVSIGFLPTICPGTDWEWSFQFLDDNDAPQDTTSWEAQCHIRQRPNGPALKKLTTENGGITMTAATGTFEILYADTDTINLKVDNVHLDVIVKDQNNIKQCSMEGEIPVRDMVTRWCSP